jgi:hypothetical protein
MRESPEVRPKSKQEFQKQAQQKFRKLAVRQFQRAWDAAIKETGADGWSRAGRLKAKSNHRTE